MLTYVTAFIDNSKLKSIDVYFESFDKMAQSGVPILLYFDEKYKDTDYDHRILTTYPNVQIPEYITIHKLTSDPVILPENRGVIKDTEDYMFIQLMKLELLTNSLKYTDTKYLAWIDFGIFYIFKNISQSQERLKYLCDCEFITDKIIVGSYEHYDPIDLWNTVCWHFFGGFLVGNRDLFEDAYKRQTKLVEENLPRLTWEVNYWHFMEDLFCKYNCVFDDTMLNTPVLID